MMTPQAHLRQDNAHPWGAVGHDMPSPPGVNTQARQKRGRERENQNVNAWQKPLRFPRESSKRLQYHIGGELAEW